MPKPLAKSTRKRTITAAEVRAPSPAATAPAPAPETAVQHPTGPKAKKLKRQRPAPSSISAESDQSLTLCVRSVASGVRIADLVRDLGDHGTMEEVVFVPGDSEWPWRVRFESAAEVRRVLAALQRPGCPLAAQPLARPTPAGEPAGRVADSPAPRRAKKPAAAAP
eukprot:EG_transcript_32142